MLERKITGQAGVGKTKNGNQTFFIRLAINRIFFFFFVNQHQL